MVRLPFRRWSSEVADEKYCVQAGDRSKTMYEEFLEGLRKQHPGKIQDGKVSDRSIHDPSGVSGRDG